MSRPPRGKRIIKLLDSLQDVYTSPDASPAERLEASQLAASILSGKRKTATTRKKRKPAKPVEPAFTGSDLVPVKSPADIARSPDDILRQFPNLAPARPI